MSEDIDTSGWTLTPKHIVWKRQPLYYTVTQGFDFETRMVISIASEGKGLVAVPFNQADKEAVDHARKILIKLGGVDPHQQASPQKKLPTLRP